MSDTCYWCGRSGDPALDIYPIVFFRKPKSPKRKPIIKGDQVALCYYCRESSPMRGLWQYVGGRDRKRDRTKAVCTLWHANTGNWVATARRVQTFFPVAEVTTKKPQAALVGIIAVLDTLDMLYRWADIDTYRKVEEIRNGSF